MLSGEPDQFVDELIRDLEICAAELASNVTVLFNASADPARQFFQTDSSTCLIFDQIPIAMHRHNNSEARKVQLQSEMHSINLSKFMGKDQVTNYGEGLTI